jgi:site-specific DNA-methyltransferase (adenine-specific)
MTSQCSITMHRGDCLDLMADVPDGSVDLILCDLPYGTTACPWDAVIPFEPLWAHYKRIITRTGAIVLTASQPFTSDVVASNRKWFKYSLVWEKSRGTGFFDVKFRPLKSHEDIVVFSPAGCSNGSKPAMAYRPQMGEGKPWNRVRRSKEEAKTAAARSAFTRTGTVSNGDRYPRSVIYFSRESTKFHPTQKPVALFEYLIKTYTNEGDTVMDNAAGSFTTAVACVNTGRSFIGMEKDAGYFATGQRRVSEAQAAQGELAR